MWLSWDLVNCWLPLATSTEVELEEGGADEEEETVEDDDCCCEDDGRREECCGSLPMPLIPAPPPTRPESPGQCETACSAFGPEDRER